MRQDLEAFLSLYIGIGVILGGFCATFIACELENKKLAARYALTCWAWPIWAAALLVYGLYRGAFEGLPWLLREAFPRKVKQLPQQVKDPDLYVAEREVEALLDRK